MFTTPPRGHWFKIKVSVLPQGPQNVIQSTSRRLIMLAGVAAIFRLDKNRHKTRRSSRRVRQRAFYQDPFVYKLGHICSLVEAHQHQTLYYSFHNHDGVGLNRFSTD